MTDSTKEDIFGGDAAPRRQTRPPDLKWTLSVTAERFGGVLVLVLAGRVSAAETDRLAERLEAAIDSGERRLVVDLSAVDYLSSRGSTLLDSAGARLAELGGRLVFCAPADAVRIVLELTGALGRLAIDPTREEAIARAVRPVEQPPPGTDQTA